MNYYRKIETSVNDLKYKMQMTALVLNVNKNKSDVISLRDNISSNLDKINDISSNLKKKFLMKTILLKTKILVLIKTLIFLIF